MKIFIILSLLLLGACVANNISEYSSKKINGSLNQTEVYAFIGKKISVNHFTPEVEEGVISLSSGYKANYEILEQFSGEMLPCLLYTSPSPRDKRQSRMPSSA